MLRLFPAAVLFFAAAGCVSVAPDQAAPPASTRIEKDVFPGLDPGGYDQQGLHFTVSAYGKERASRISDDLEKDYSRIMQDTGLFSFRPGGTYQVVVYANSREYRDKTGTPEWSSGATVRNTIYSYESPGLNGTLAHEMTHLIFNEFMAQDRGDLKWINEGLAVYEEMQATSPGIRQSWERQIAQMRGAPLAFESMRTLVPSEQKAGEVSLWYAQVASVVGFIIEKGGRIGFESLLSALKDRTAFDAALKATYPQYWTDFKSLERDWLRG